MFAVGVGVAVAAVTMAGHITDRRIISVFIPAVDHQVPLHELCVADDHFDDRVLRAFVGELLDDVVLVVRCLPA